MSELTAAARRWGIATDYYDVFGRRHAAGAQALSRLIEIMREAGAAPRPAEPPPAPVAAYQGDGQKHWGLAAQLFSLRSGRDWGIGDFTDLANLVTLAGRRGAAAVGLNPLHALFVERPEDVSPYAPNSRLFLNPLYIDVDAIPEFPGLAAAGLATEVAALRASQLVAYDRVAAAKLHALRIAHRAFARKANAARRADFAAYKREQGEALLRFGCFEVLRRQFMPALWPDWPRHWKNPDRARLDEFRRAHGEECEFQEFLQWTADRQLAACQQRARAIGMPIGLYVDVAVGIDRRGADAWSGRGTVLGGVAMGAPSDEFNPAGQDWGIAPFNPHALPENDFAPLRQLLRTAMRHAGAIRLDHALGLKRVFMIPSGRPASEGAYVRFPFESLLSVLAEESRGRSCIVIGEDLGTVPEHFRETMARWGLWSYRVMMFERERGGRFRPPEQYPAAALATFGTHDLPTYRGWLTSHDLRVKRGLGLDPGEDDAARLHALRCMRDILAECAPGCAGGDIAAVATFLAATPSRLAVMAIDDVLGIADQVNIPGTVAQHPNWRRKLPVTLDELENHDGLQRIALAFAQGGRAIAL